MSQLEKEKEAMLISELFKGNLIQLYTFLRNFNFNPVLLRDIKNNNAIHISCLNNNSALVEFLIRYVEEYYPKISIENWVNEKNNDGITSLHFAVFRGNFVFFN